MPPLKPPYAPVHHGAPLTEGATFALDAQAMRGLAFREINVKEAFTLLDASGQFFRASLTSKSDDGSAGEAVAYERLRGSTESPARITLVCAVLARQRMILVTQKATELGCIRIVPVLSDHSVKPADLEKEKPWAWAGQAIKGARQCRRASVPEVLKTQTLEAAIASASWAEASLRFVLDDRSPSADPFPAPTDSPAERDIVLAVGPEGGWSDRERAALTAAGATPLALGTRILRAETAVFAGLSVLQHRLGDLRAF